MRVFLLFFFVSFFSYSAISSAKNDSLLSVLKTELGRRKFYDDQKEARINHLKNRLEASSKSDYKSQYEICLKLYEEYKSYQFDSAYVYTQKLLTISRTANDIPKQYEARIKLGSILLYSGMFKETFDCLNQINPRRLGDSAR